MNGFRKAVLIVGTGAAALRALVGETKPAKITDQVAIAPALQGSHGRAWRVDLAALAAKADRKYAAPALAVWLIEAAWAHPVWHSYIIGLAHLRPIEGAPPAQICLEGATHEFWIWAACPETSREAFIRGDLGLNAIALQPCNFGAQLRCPSDSAATRLIEIAAQEICDGKLNPDTDFFDRWVDRFGESLVRPQYKRAAK